MAQNEAYQLITIIGMVGVIQKMNVFKISRIFVYKKNTTSLLASFWLEMEVQNRFGEDHQLL